MQSHPELQFTETQDWFSGNIPRWRLFFAQVSSTSPRALEIGTWEGRSAVFTLLELCKAQGSLVCIDHFDAFQTEAGRERFRKVTHNLDTTGLSHRILPQFSVPGLIQLLREAECDPTPGFDWVYIDGSHEASDTFLDGELSWRLARNNAIIVFDDYRWDVQPSDSPHHPKKGIDSFLTLHQGEFEVLSGTKEYEYQMVLRKVVDMKIGFSFDSTRPDGMLQVVAQDSPLNIAFATDSAYAMPTAVAISTALKHTPGRITIYVLDCGLTDSDRARIQTTLPKGRSEVTLVFLELPANNLAMELGLTWSKLDLIEALPIERALYLDSDTLIRKDIRPVWFTDLGDKLIAAAPDVGHPFGRETEGNPDHRTYFNAGVILLDLTRIRARNSNLCTTAQSMKDSFFKDQDALNRVFGADWLELSLRWNATGMGTYANIPTPERSALRLHEMIDPCIVHFTGPVHPPMAHVTNPWVQPYVAKPWGYAGAPGHPHAAEWWDGLAETGWSNWKDSQEYTEMKETQTAKAIQDGLTAFERTLKMIHVD
ncbi:hypothetical protein FRC12_006831 [Ceratobasidium sp. 428]|nr:hypothetical protein FRC12_006831 [Ceratobasidium sp. 428]